VGEDLGEQEEAKTVPAKLPMKMRCHYLARSDLRPPWERMDLDLFAVLAPVGWLKAQLALVDCELDLRILLWTDCTKPNQLHLKGKIDSFPPLTS
jgi:hypothetical protein